MECGAGSPSYYRVLGVRRNASDEEIRRACHGMFCLRDAFKTTKILQWHPDKWTKNPVLLGEANQKFQQIQEAYSVLSDRRKRVTYDAGLYDPDDEEEEVEGFADFLQEMVSLMNDARKEEKDYSMEELQSMFWEMAKYFQTPAWDNYSVQQYAYESQWFCGPSRSLHQPGNAGTNSWEGT